MKQLKPIWLILLLLLLSLPITGIADSASAPVKLSIITGAEDGTYFAIAKDMEKLLAKHGIDLTVIPSAGTLQNVSDVNRYNSIPLGFAQKDVIAYINVALDNEDDEAKQLSKNLRTLLPLYQEEVHLLVSADIKKMADLNGKKIAIGEFGSGTSVTAMTLLELNLIEAADLVNTDINDAIRALRAGEISGVFYVVGAPTEVLTKKIKASDTLHLIPVMIKDMSDKKFTDNLYTTTELPAGTYPWQEKAVKTLDVSSILITTASANCTHMGKVAKAIMDNLAWLQQEGHPKWKSVTFDAKKMVENNTLSPCTTKLTKKQ